MPRRLRAALALSAALACTACSGKADGGPGLVHAITIQPQAAALCLGDSQVFTAQAFDGAGHLLPGTPVRWISSAPGAVAIDAASGVARALSLGGTQISATAGGATATASLDVPADLLPEFVPDSAVLAPSDTMTLGVRLRRASSGPVPNHVPRIAAFDSAVAGLDTTGLVRAKAAGAAGLSLSACGFTGHGGVKVFAAPDSITGQAYLWLSNASELRIRLPARVINFVTHAGRPAFQVVSEVGSHAKVFVYEDTLTLAGTGTFPVDSLLSTEVATAPCTPPRPFATYADNTPLTALFSLRGGSTVVTTYVPMSNYKAVSGRTVVLMRGLVAGAATLDTVQAIYTFSAPLKDTANACP